MCLFNLRLCRSEPQGQGWGNSGLLQFGCIYICINRYIQIYVRRNVPEQNKNTSRWIYIYVHHIYTNIRVNPKDMFGFRYIQISMYIYKYTCDETYLSSTKIRPDTYTSMCTINIQIYGLTRKICLVLALAFQRHSSQRKRDWCYQLRYIQKKEEKEARRLTRVAAPSPRASLGRRTVCGRTEQLSAAGFEALQN